MPPNVVHEVYFDIERSPSRSSRGLHLDGMFETSRLVPAPGTPVRPPDRRGHPALAEPPQQVAFVPGRRDVIRAPDRHQAKDWSNTRRRCRMRSRSPSKLSSIALPKTLATKTLEILTVQCLEPGARAWSPHMSKRGRASRTPQFLRAEERPVIGAKPRQ
jgi:hypothetical protein